MANTTVAIVRSESGFDNNSDITDATITIYVDLAAAEVKGFVARIYDMAEMEASAKFSSSQAEAFLKGVETLWASGLLLIKEYGAEAQNADKDGYRKLELAKAMLLDLQEERVMLLDTDNVEFERMDDTMGGVIVAGGAEDDEQIFAEDDTY
jgi:hypothetical protein